MSGIEQRLRKLINMIEQLRTELSDFNGHVTETNWNAKAWPVSMVKKYHQKYD